MYIIGVIAKEKEFNEIEKEVKKNIPDTEISLININSKTIKNIKNIKFSIIVINGEIIEYNQNKEIVKYICQNAKYILINSDIKMSNQIIQNENSSIITVGLNLKSTITISSITEEEILVSIQREIINIQGKKLEVQEKKKKMDKLKTNNKNNIYSCLIAIAIEIIIKS